VITKVDEQEADNTVNEQVNDEDNHIVISFLGIWDNDYSASSNKNAIIKSFGRVSVYLSLNWKPIHNHF